MKKLLSLVLALMLLCTSSVYFAAGAEEAAHKHTPSSDKPIDNLLPTCEDKGWDEFVCADKECGQTYKKEVKALGHDWKVVKTTEATCDAPKTIESKCERCGKTKTETEGEKLAHKFVDEVTSVAATCAAAGSNTTVSYCELCGVYQDNVVESIPQRVHGDEFYGLFDMKGDECIGATFVGKKEAADGFGEITCALKEPTCTEDGSVTVSCALCGLTETRVIKAPGHDEVSTVVKEPDCMINGVTRYTCKNCKETYTVETLARGFHQFDGEKTYKQQKVGDKELKVYTKDEIAKCLDYIVYTKCSGCSAVKEETIKGTGDHKLEKVLPIKEATCKAEGTRLIQCADCGKATYEVIPQLKHDWVEDIAKRKAPTCTEDGVRVSECKLCKEIKTEVIPTNGHTKLKVEDVKATCTKDGYHKETCLACGVVVKNEVIAAHHTYDPSKVNAITPATCDKPGFVNYTCVECGAVVKHEEIPALHHFVDGVDQRVLLDPIDATCEVAKQLITECKLCHVKEIEYVGEPRKHEEKEGSRITYQPAVCEVAGKAYAQCKFDNCKKTFEIVLDPLEHEFDTTWDAANKAWVNKCTKCGKVVTISFKAPSYSVATSGITMTSSKTTGSGKIKLDDMCQPLNEAYVRITWSYTLKNGDSLSFVACVPVRKDGTFKANGPSAPAGAVLESVLILVVDNADADDQSLSSVSKYGTATLS